jgi:transketolase
MASASMLEKGAYVLSEAQGGEAQAIVIATGSEVHEALRAQALLQEKGLRIRVVSMPSWELFAAQSKTYQASVLPPHITQRVAVEAGVGMGWERWTGSEGLMVGVPSYGASAPGPVLLKDYGITAEHVAEAVQTLLKHV